MTRLEKQELLSEISELLESYVINSLPSAPVTPTPQQEVPELLTIKECTEMFRGLTEFTLRQMIARKEITAVRAGTGKQGKFLVEKSSLIRYLSGT